jgi:hypothetical protein
VKAIISGIAVEFLLMGLLIPMLGGIGPPPLWVTMLYVLHYPGTWLIGSFSFLQLSALQTILLVIVIYSAIWSFVIYALLRLRKRSR